MAKTAVVLLNYNNVTDTTHCVNSLLALSEPVQIILVDNASTEKGIEEIAALSPQIELIQSDANLGFGRGNNLGIRWALQHTDCDYIFVLNNDTTVEPDVVSQLESFMDSHKDIGVAAPRILMMETNDCLWYGGGYIYWPKGSARAPGYRGPANSATAMEERDVSFASGCAMFIRRKVFEEIGGFDPRYFMYEEDVELCLRIQAANWKIRYLPSAVIWHRGQGSTRAGKQKFLSIQDPNNPKLAFFTYHITRNKLLNMATHASGKNMLMFWSIFPFHLGLSVAKFAVHGRWDAIAAAAKGVGAFLKDRKTPFINELM
jgi:hypothetical protein